MPNADCPECQGTGWKPVVTDGVRSVTPCVCRQADHAEDLLVRARIPKRYEHCALENFSLRKDKDTHLTNATLRAARLTAEGFVHEYPVDYGLLFVGPTGVGKTHLAVAVVRELIIRKSVDCLFQDFRELLKKIQDSYNSIAQSTEYRVIQPLLDVEVLLLDEMASANPSDWVKETLSHIINSRYNQKKVTLITTTLPFGEPPSRGSRRGGKGEEVRMPSGDAVPDMERTLNQFGVTLRSRLYEMCRLIEMHSSDFRKDIKQAGYRVHGESNH